MSRAANKGPDRLSGRILIAVPALETEGFKRSVMVICQHGPEGALGVAINRRLAGMRLGDVFRQMGLTKVDRRAAELPVYVGGPVERERGFVIYRPAGSWEVSLTLGEGIAVALSTDVLEAMAEGTGPDEALVAFGYAGWGPGQLEEEICEGSWLLGPLDAELIFDHPVAGRWRRSAELAGVDLSKLVNTVGHA